MRNLTLRVLIDGERGVDETPIGKSNFFGSEKIVNIYNVGVIYQEIFLDLIKQIQDRQISNFFTY